METLTIKSHVGHDGVLRLETPVGVADVDCDVVIILPSSPSHRLRMTGEEWNQFVDHTAGSLADDPIERFPQSEYEQREPLG